MNINYSKLPYQEAAMNESTNKETTPNEKVIWLHAQAVALIDKGELVLPPDLKKAFLEFNELSSTKQLELINQLSMLKGLPTIVLDLIKLKQPRYFDTLPNDIFKETGTYIENEQEMKALALTDERAYSLFQPNRIFATFLQHVVYGKQDKAEQVFTVVNSEEKKQDVLLRTGTVTDYSGRAFEAISAYEYAYWAKDTHMCRMLEQHMDADTKADMLKRCKAIEKNGLTYTQNGVEVKGSKHFDFTPLKKALRNYIDGYDNWYSTNNWAALDAAWMQVGIAQRDVPVHVANEYCRKDRSFKPTPTFNEDNLPRELTFYNLQTHKNELWFPLVISDSSGLGVDFALIRYDANTGLGAGGPGGALGPANAKLKALTEWEAIDSLDKVRTADLTLSREYLGSTEPWLDNAYNVF